MANKKILTEGSDSADVITMDKLSAQASAAYEINDFVKAAQKIFGYTGALVEAALKLAGKEKYTVEEAKQIVRAFANKPVTR